LTLLAPVSDERLLAAGFRVAALPPRVAAPPVDAAGTAAAVPVASRADGGGDRGSLVGVAPGSSRAVAPAASLGCVLPSAAGSPLPAPSSDMVVTAALLHAAALPLGGVTAAVAGDGKPACLGPPVATANGNATVSRRCVGRARRGWRVVRAMAVATSRR